MMKEVTVNIANTNIYSCTVVNLNGNRGWYNDAPWIYHLSAFHSYNPTPKRIFSKCLVQKESEFVPSDLFSLDVSPQGQRKKYQLKATMCPCFEDPSLKT